MHCRIRASGNPLCTHDWVAIGSDTVNPIDINAVILVSGSAGVRIDFSVAEDRGAILATVATRTLILIPPGPTDTTVLAVNGGRPF